MTPAPRGVPAIWSQPFHTWLVLQAEWMGGLPDAAKYERFCEQWVVTAEE